VHILRDRVMYTFSVNAFLVQGVFTTPLKGTLHLSEGFLKYFKYSFTTTGSLLGGY